MVLARVVIHVLARVLPHVLARVLLHVLARVIIHVHDYYSKTCVQVPLPVMVWIHGGALLAGSGTFQEHGPQHLLDK